LSVEATDFVTTRFRPTTLKTLPVKVSSTFKIRQLMSVLEQVTHSTLQTLSRINKLDAVIIVRVPSSTVVVLELLQDVFQSVLALTNQFATLPRIRPVARIQTVPLESRVPVEPVALAFTMKLLVPLLLLLPPPLLLLLLNPLLLPLHFLVNQTQLSSVNL
jgi:hypothetical protein